MERHTNEEMDELKLACKAVVDFLYKYGNPHMSVIVTQTDAELVSGEICVHYEPRD